MKTILTLLICGTYTLLSSCASKPASTGILDAATPVRTKTPDTGSLKNNLKGSGGAVKNATKSNTEAGKSVTALKGDVATLKNINDRFAANVDKLKAENAQMAIEFDTIRGEYTTVIDELGIRVASLELSLNTTQESLDQASMLLFQSELDTFRLEGELSASQAELEKFRADRKTMLDQAKKHEDAAAKAQKEADENKTYKVIFWRVVIGIVIFLGLMFYFKPPFMGRLFSR